MKFFRIDSEMHKLIIPLSSLKLAIFQKDHQQAKFTFGEDTILVAWNDDCHDEFVEFLQVDDKDIFFTLDLIDD